MYIGESGSESPDDSDEEEFVYPGGTTTVQPEEPSYHPPQHPSPAQLESLYAAASSGDLLLLQRLFRNALESGDVQPFSLANDASTRTGLTALHAAASRGYLDIVIWCALACSDHECGTHGKCLVVESCGAMPDLEDKEGEVGVGNHRLSFFVFIINS